MNDQIGPDFIATELLNELKTENIRKGKQIQSLHILLGTCLFLLLGVVTAFLIFMNQFELTDETYTTSNAEGVYALIDSNGNIIADDLTPEQIEGVVNSYSTEDNLQKGIVDTQNK